MRARILGRLRGGFTLVELLSAIVLLGLVVTALTSVLVGQERFYGDTTDVIETRGTVRDLAEFLPGEIRGLSPKSGDITAMSSTSLDYRASIGASVVCAKNGAGTSIVLPATGKTNGLTSWLSEPQIGDSLLIYDEGTRPDTSDDVPQLHAITAAVAVGVCPTSTGFSADATEAANGFTLVVDPALTATEAVGASIRFFRPAHYELYQASDSQWYLGYYDCLSSRATACSTIQPVSGPYMPPASGSSPGGLVFTYFDRTGTATADPLQVARIDIAVRSQSARSNLEIAGHAGSTYTDSLKLSVAVRN